MSLSVNRPSRVLDKDNSGVLPTNVLGQRICKYFYDGHVCFMNYNVGRARLHYETGVLKHNCGGCTLALAYMCHEYMLEETREQSLARNSQTRPGSVFQGNVIQCLVDTVDLNNEHSPIACVWIGLAIEIQEYHKPLKKCLQEAGFNDPAVHYTRAAHTFVCADGFYFLGTHSLYVNDCEEKAVECFSKALEIDEHHSSSLYALGDCYVYGLGVELNKNTALKYHVKGADLGHGCCAYECYKVLYHQGFGGSCSRITKILDMSSPREVFKSIGLMEALRSTERFGGDGVVSEALVNQRDVENNDKKMKRGVKYLQIAADSGDQRYIEKFVACCARRTPHFDSTLTWKYYAKLLKARTYSDGFTGQTENKKIERVLKKARKRVKRYTEAFSDKECRFSTLPPLVLSRILAQVIGPFTFIHGHGRRGLHNKGYLDADQIYEMIIEVQQHK